MRQGVTLQDPSRLDVRGELAVGQDVTIDINVIVEGHVKIGSHCTIGANTILRNVIIGDHVDIKSHCVIDGAEISEHSVIGPYARLRPGTVLGPQTHIGNFVEIKNSDVGLGSKINHLSYIGDSEIGKHVNIGAGTITCNYDGVNKQRTVIGDYAFIGSDTQLIAPVTIGAGATIGAGSTITRDAPANELTICRVPQRSIKKLAKTQEKGNLIMCGIVGAVAERNIVKLLIDGLKRLEYRGYDSAGIAVITASGVLERVRAKGKVRELELALKDAHLSGKTGIAHTRWATHGIPSEHNAHPLVSSDEIAIVHNGIIENHETA